MSESLFSSECPVCGTELQFDFHTRPTACSKCGEPVVLVQDGETWTDDEVLIAVWKCDETMRRDFGVPDCLFEPRKNQ